MSSEKLALFLALFFAGLLAILAGDLVGTRYLAIHELKERVTFSNRADHKPNVWPFELFLAPPPNKRQYEQRW